MLCRNHGSMQPQAHVVANYLWSGKPRFPPLLTTLTSINPFPCQIQPHSHVRSTGAGISAWRPRGAAVGWNLSVLLPNLGSKPQPQPSAMAETYKPKSILLTGGAGFIGSHVAIKLVLGNPDVKVCQIEIKPPSASSLRCSALPWGSLHQFRATWRAQAGMPCQDGRCMHGPPRGQCQAA
jgi:hypothetical protein